MAKNNEKLKDIEEKLLQGVESCLNSDGFKRWLNTMSKFTHYSLNNQLLIALQNPDATHVAAFKKWQAMNRKVKQGEKGIMIIVPYTKKKEMTDENGSTLLDDDGNPITKIYQYFGKGYVFDVSQTEGEELPSICKELMQDVKDFTDIKDALVNISPVKVFFEDTQSSAKGYYSAAEEKIVIQEGMSELQTIKTLLHEIAHARLGHGEKDCKLTRDEKELQAESVAYSVAAYLNLDTSDYTFEYLSSWSISNDTENLKNQMDSIRTGVIDILDALNDSKLMSDVA